MHLGIAPFIPILGRGRCRDQGRVDDGALAHHQTLVGQMSVDALEDLACESVLFEQTAKLQQGGRIGRRLPCQVDADEATDCLAVLDRVLDPFVREAEALLGDVHPQHPPQPNRLAAAAVTLQIERLNLGFKRRPRRDRLNLGEEAITSRPLFS